MNLNLLAQMDDYFHEKGSSFLRIVIMLLFSLIAYLIYDNTYEDAEHQHEALLSQINEIQLKNEEHRRCIAENSDERYADLEKQKLSYDEERQQAIAVSDEFKERIAKIPYLTYEQKYWADFLNLLSKSAASYNLRMELINTDIQPGSAEALSSIMKVEATIKGNYPNLVKYLNTLEAQDFLVEISKIDIRTDEESKNLNSNITFIVWGLGS